METHVTESPEDIMPRARMNTEGSGIQDGGSQSAELLANIQIHSPISIVVPTYRERENLPHLVARIESLKARVGVDFEVLIVDDDSRDGSEEWVNTEAPDWVRIIVRTANRGLSPAVIEGLRAAKYPVVVVMDADLSHPPERIPDMILALQSGQQLVIGSRYVPGGSTDEEWGFFRWLNSRVATSLAWPLTKTHDPMSGFFALRRCDFERARHLNPIGYKICLELIVKCGLKNVGEIPIHFTDRIRCQSKLSLSEQLKYLIHLRRLYIYKYATWSSIVQFGVVGAIGVIVNMVGLTAALFFNAPKLLALAVGIAISIVSNFFLNRRFTFYYARSGNVWSQFLGFTGAASVGALISFGVAAACTSMYPAMALQVAALFGVAAGLVFNFIINRYWVFKARAQ